MSDKRLADLEAWRRKIEASHIIAERLLFAQTASVTVTNTASETTLVGAGVGSLSLPANWFAPGRVVRVTTGGSFGYTSTPTIVLRNYFGSVNCGGTTVMTLAGVPTGVIVWNYTNTMTCRSIGATGSFVNTTRVDWIRDAANGTAQTAGATATNSVDTTAAMSIDFMAQWGTANAANTITCNVLVVEVLN